MKKIYLAGPDVFRENAIEFGKQLKEKCALFGFQGLFPLDNEVDLCKDSASLIIYNANVDMIKSCDIVLANLDQFRGPSTDPGTSLEIGMALGMGKPVYGYNSKQEIDYKSRVYTIGNVCKEYPIVEDFGLTDNLMIVHGCNSLFGSVEQALSFIKEKFNANSF